MVILRVRVGLPQEMCKKERKKEEEWGVVEELGRHESLAFDLQKGEKKAEKGQKKSAKTK